MKYPEDSVQDALANGNWWVEHKETTLCRGALIWCFVPHVDQTPYAFEPVARKVPTEHTSAEVKVTPIKVDQALRQVELPVAAMPRYENEVWAAYRAKCRPCVVLSERGHAVDGSLTKGMPNRNTAQMMLIAPYFGVDQDGSRAGFNREFVDRVRRCEYPQFFWDALPTKSGPAESLLRLDQFQPMGCHHHAFRLGGYRLSDEALDIVDAMLHWLVWGGIPEGHDLLAFQQLMRETFG